MTLAKNGFCPKCSHGQLKFRERLEKWYCRTCKHIFDEPIGLAPKPKTNSGSGVIAPRTYRQEIAFQLLGKLQITQQKYYGK